MCIVRVPFFSLCAVLFWHCAKASAEPIGLVLSGGGAKGAYEVGVWQGLQAVGLASKVTAISGTSVGALNAALFATRPDDAERLWFERMGDVFTVNTNRVGESVQKTLNDVSNAVDRAKQTGDNWKGVVSFSLATLVRVADKYVKTVESPEKTVGYIDSSKIASVLDDILPKKWPSSTPSVYATAVEKGQVKVSEVWCLNSQSPEQRSRMICASAAFPYAFDSVPLGDKVYVDGGWEEKGGDNSPISPILDNHPEIKTVVVVYLNDEKHLSLERRNRVRIAAGKKGVKVVEILPSKDIDGPFGLGLFNASPKTARNLIELGRKDAREALLKAGLTKGVSESTAPFVK